MARRLEKSRNRLLLGVAGGIADYFKVDPMIIRVIFVLLAFANGVGVLLYLLLALFMPKTEAAPAEPFAVVKDNIKTAPREAKEAGRRVVQVLRGTTEEKKESDEHPSGQQDGAPPVS